MLWQRLRVTSSLAIRLFYVVRTFKTKEAIGRFRNILEMLTTDRQFRAFHEGETTELPEFYHQEYERMLGPYAPLISRAERTPELVPASAPTATASTH